MLSRERSITAPVHSDEAIEYWGEVYLATPAIAARGVPFENFLWRPVAVLTTLGIALPRPAAPSACAPPAEITRAVVDLERGGARCANGTLIEKLRHHRYVTGVKRLPEAQP